MRRIIAQTRKELTQIVRDWRTMMLALILPLILLILLGSAISLSVTDMPIVVQDLDDSPSSHKLIDAFRASLTLRVVSWPTDRQPEKALSSSKAPAALIIPAHFEQNLQRGGDATHRRCCRCKHGASDSGRRKPDCRRLQPGHKSQRTATTRSRGDSSLVQPRSFVEEVLWSGHLRARTFDLSAVARRARHGQRRRSKDDPSGLCFKHSRVGVSARQIARVYGRRAGRKRRDAGFVVHLFRFEFCRRSDSVCSRHNSLCILRRIIWHDDRRDDLQPGGSNASRGPRRFPLCLSSFRSALSD